MLFDFQDSPAIKEVVSWLGEEPVTVELGTLSAKPFQSNF